MTNTNLKEYKGFSTGSISVERMGNTNKFRKVLCKGIYIDKDGYYFTGHQYIDQRLSRTNKRITVSGKSSFWFNKII